MKMKMFQNKYLLATLFILGGIVVMCFIFSGQKEGWSKGVDIARYNQNPSLHEIVIPEEIKRTDYTIIKGNWLETSKKCDPYDGLEQGILHAFCPYNDSNRVTKFRDSKLDLNTCADWAANNKGGTLTCTNKKKK